MSMLFDTKRMRYHFTHKNYCIIWWQIYA